jgi:hypothetical protein
VIDELGSHAIRVKPKLAGELAIYFRWLPVLR